MVNQTLTKASGDLHNFGNRVLQINSTTIYKPRVMFWEWLFLDPKSPFRSYINTIFSNSIFNPILAHHPLSVFNETEWSGFVEVLITDPVIKLSSDEAFLAGSCVGFWSWCGLIDLHLDNIKLGRKEGKLIFMPIDIEAGFHKVFTAFDTLLITPTNYHAPEIGGLQHLSGFINNNELLKQFILGFVYTIRLLDNHSSQIHALVYRILQPNTPFRIIIRPTKEYYLKKISYFIEEQVQLDRGDIPYFFSNLNTVGSLLYFSSPQVVSTVNSDVSSLYFLNSLMQKSHDFNWSQQKTLVFTAQFLNYFLTKNNQLMYDYSKINCDFLQITTSGIQVTLPEAGINFILRKND